MIVHMCGFLISEDLMYLHFILAFFVFLIIKRERKKLDINCVY